jgi:hypothetical protein
MPKAALNIFKVGTVYRAVAQVGENPRPVSMGIVVYQDGEEMKTMKDKNTAIGQLKEKAKKWARQQNIPFVHNIDINPYD